MFSRKLLFVPVFFGTFFFSTAHAQSAIADSSLLYATGQPVQSYINSRGNSLQLYNGVEYVFLYQQVKGFPFYSVNRFEENNIVYDGILYQHVPLAYDIVSNQVITKTLDNNYLQLIPEKINSFTINNHLFVRLAAADVANTALTPGFYDATINNAAALLIKHEKVVIHSSKPEEPDHFNEYNYYYLKKGDTYYAVKNSRTLLKILQDKSSELKAFMHQYKLNFKKNPELALIRMIEYYAQLMK
jgi:hypothetical protein